MDVTRFAVLEQLGHGSDAERRETTTVEALAAELDADEAAIEAHLDGLASCELARRESDGGVRITTTGEELLELDVDEVVIVDPATEGSDPSGR
ncbi:MAG: DNA-binding IclR family transcriptional regulator [Halobacteriales archaeon]|jgi:DNA-binding IclR family transcriptional regulator